MASSITDGVVDSRFFSTKKVSVLLDDTNYLLWRQQILLVIKTFKLQSFLDSRTVPHPQFLSNDDGVPQENLEFIRFKQQDSARILDLILCQSIRSSTSYWYGH